MKKEIIGFDGNEEIIEKIIGYRFRDRSLLRQAFTRTSFCNEQNGRTSIPYQSNEVLEFFGDSVLSAVIVTYFVQNYAKRYRHGIYTELREGDFSNLKSRLSDKRNLAKTIHGIGLQRYLIMGEGDEKLRISEEMSVMEDLFESIVGAIYIDSGMDLPTVTRAVSGILDLSAFLKPGGGSPSHSPKNALQEYCARPGHRRGEPKYETVGERGPEHMKTYFRAVSVDGVVLAVGEGKNMKAADTAAAEAALRKLRELDA